MTRNLGKELVSDKGNLINCLTKYERIGSTIRITRIKNKIWRETLSENLIKTFSGKQKKVFFDLIKEN